MIRLLCIAAWCLGVILAQNALARDSEPPSETGEAAQAVNAQIGGPGSVDATLEQDDTATPAIKEKISWLDKYFAFKKTIQQKTGLALGLDYTALGQLATASPEDSGAASSVFRFFGTWNIARNEQASLGSLVFKVENRHRLGTDSSPQSLGGELGYAGLTGLGYSDKGWILTNAYYQNRFLDNHLAVTAGIVDVTDYVDTYAFMNNWTDFVNSSFSTNPTIPAPSQGLGAAVRANVDHLYLLAGLANSEGDPTDPGQEFNTFFNDNNYFTHLEVGWFGSWENKFANNVHVTLWHADSPKDSGIPTGKGIVFSANHLVAENWLPFLRMGWADGGGAFVDRDVSLGLGRYFRDKSDLLALGLSWGHPSEDIARPDRTDQYTVEAFYRIQLLDTLALTPDLQLLINPALDSENDVIALFGFRVRLSF